MKKLCICCLLASILLCSFSCISSKNIKDSSLSIIVSSGVFKVGVSSENMAPATFINAQGVWDGFDVTLARKIAENMGVEIVFVGISEISNVITELNNGTIDCYWSNYCITSEREKEVAFSIPYVRCNAVIAVKKNKSYTSIEDMKGLTLGYLKGSSSENAITDSDNQYLSKYLVFKVFNNDDVMYADFKSGAIDSMVADETYLKYEMQQNALLKILNDSSGNPIVINRACAGVAFSRASSELKSYINRELYSLASSGYLKEACLKFYAEDLSAVNL